DTVENVGLAAFQLNLRRVAPPTPFTRSGVAVGGGPVTVEGGGADGVGVDVRNPAPARGGGTRRIAAAITVVIMRVIGNTNTPSATPIQCTKLRREWRRVESNHARSCNCRVPTVASRIVIASNRSTIFLPPMRGSLPNLPATATVWEDLCCRHRHHRSWNESGSSLGVALEWAINLRRFLCQIRRRSLSSGSCTTPWET